ncbi:MAG: SPOCS domain-containing protein [Halanaerobiales bacterium]
MAINFNEELIRVEYVIGEETVAESITGTITIPDEKPPAERIIDVKEFGINNLQTTIEEGGVDITGDIEVGVTYVGVVEETEPQQPVHFVHGTLNLANFVDIPEAEPGMNVFVDITVRRVSFDQIDIPPLEPGEDFPGVRTLEVTVVIQKFVKVTEYRQITVITEVTGIPEENVTEELLRIEDVIGENTVTVVVSGELTPPPELGKPPIERILSTTAELEGEVATEITEDGVIIDGEIFGGVMYVGIVEEGEPQQPVHFLEDTFTFSETVDVPGAEEGMSAHTNLSIQKVSFDEIFDEDGNIVTVEVDVVLRMFVKITEPKQVRVVTDIISDQVELERELLRVEDVVGEDTIHETTTQRLLIPEADPIKPPATRIIESEARIVDRDITVEPGGVLIDMVIEGSIIYVGAVEDTEPQQPVHFYHDTFPYDNFVDIPGAEPGMNAHVEVEVTKSSAELVNLNTAGNTRQVDITVVIRKFAKVTEFRQLEIVTDIIVVSPAADGECPPSYVVYVVQAGDTLYKISRRYRTTVDALIQANPDIDSNNLRIGQKICVPSGIISPRG